MRNTYISQDSYGIRVEFDTGEIGHLVFGVGVGCVVSATSPQTADKLYEMYTSMKASGELKCVKLRPEQLERFKQYADKINFKETQNVKTANSINHSTK